MSHQWRSGRLNGCALCAEKAEAIDNLSTGIQQLAEKNQAEKERLDRIFLRIENCERLARELGLYEAKKSEFDEAKKSE